MIIFNHIIFNILLKILSLDVFFLIGMHVL